MQHAVPVDAKHGDMGNAARHGELLVLGRKLGEELVKLGLGGIAIGFGAGDQHRAGDLGGIDERQVDRHVDVGARRGGVAERQLIGGQRLGHVGIEGRGIVAAEDSREGGQIHGAEGLGLVALDRFPPAHDFGGAFAGPGEGVEDQALDALGMAHGEHPGADRARRLALEHEFLLAGDLLDHRHGRLDVCDAGLHVGIDAGVAAGAAIVLVVERPDVETGGGEIVHHRIVRFARYLKVKAAAA